MELNSQKLNDVNIVSISGSIDALTAGDVQRYFDEQISHIEGRVIIDLKQVDFMSSAGLRVIMAVSKEVRQQGGDFRLAAAQPTVERMLKISGFTSIFKSFPDVEAAIASFENNNI